MENEMNVNVPLEIIKASEIEPKEVKWLWYPYIPFGKVTLPPRNTDDRRVFAYLRKRGIAPQVIRQFLNSGLVYEDAEHHNCVFVGKNSAGQVK